MGGRGEMTTFNERKSIIADIKNAIVQGARKEKACRLIGLTIRTLQRWDNNSADKRPDAIRVSPKALSQDEKAEILRVCNSNEYKDMSPNEIVPILAQKGVYIASESSFYRVLRENNLLHHRSDTRAPIARKAPFQLQAVGPNQVWSWDITYLKTTINGIYFYLYLFMDIWSRKITGWTVELCEDGKISSDLMKTLCDRDGIKDLHLHSDNGGPMKCGTMLATLQWLGITPSFSRPSVSNDNPFSESLFKTMKYRPAYPKEFKTIEDARIWVNHFVEWYNTEHHHSGIRYVTPDERHSGADIIILEQRKETYRFAQMRRPERWSKSTRNWNQIKEVTLNRKKTMDEEKKCA